MTFGSKWTYFGPGRRNVVGGGRGGVWEAQGEMRWIWIWKCIQRNPPSDRYSSPNYCSLSQLAGAGIAALWASTDPKKFLKHFLITQIDDKVPKWSVSKQFYYKIVYWIHSSTQSFWVWAWLSPTDSQGTSQFEICTPNNLFLAPTK